MIGRIPVINLNARQSELYFLRMLLYHKPGAMCFDDIRRVNGEVQPTYQEACIKMGLLEDDTEIDRVMEEALLVQFRSTLRAVFATVLMFITPSNPLAFWERHKRVLCEDIMHQERVQHPSEEIVSKVLFDISEYLERFQPNRLPVANS